MSAISPAAMLVLLLFLVAAAVTDVREKLVDIRLLAAFSLIELVIIAGGGEWDLKSRLAGIAAGLIFFLFSLAFNGAIGSGDGLVIMLIGAVMGGRRLMGVLAIAWALAFFFAAFKIMRGKRDRIAFIPFLLISCYLTLLLELCGGF